MHRRSVALSIIMMLVFFEEARIGIQKSDFVDHHALLLRLALV